MKNSLLIVTLALAVSACAATGTKAPHGATQAPRGKNASSAPLPAPATVVAQASVPVTTGSSASVAEPEQPDPLPSLSLTPELMFRILGAELAFQRGDWQSAYVTTLALARQTGDPRLARRAAEFAHLARQQPELLNAVRLWRELAPGSAEANQYFLGFVVAGGKLDEALPILEQHMRDARPQVRGALAFQFQSLLAGAKDKAAAFALLDKVFAPYLEVPEVRLALAQAAIANADLPRARQEAQAALQAKPDSEIAILTLVQATPDHGAASRLLQDFLARRPDAREVRLAHARLLIESKQYDQASAEFSRLLANDPQDLGALFALGVLNVEMREFGTAEKYLTAYLDALEQNPEQDRDPTQALLLLAQIAEERKDTDSLLKWLDRIESGEAYVSAQIKRAQVVARRDGVEQARALLREVSVESEREQAALVMAEGQLLRDANRVADALQVLEAGLKQDPDNTDLLYDYAMLAEKNRKWEAMETALRKIIRIAPEHQHAYNALGYSLADRNIRLEEARELIAKALALAPQDAFIMDSMGWVEYRLGRLDEAERLLRRAYQLRPDVEIATHLGEVLWVKGEREAAEKLWRDAQAKDPQNDTLKSTLARLNPAP